MRQQFLDHARPRGHLRRGRVLADQPVPGQVVLVQGGAGAVGQCATALARHAGATVIATVRSDADRAVAERAGAHHVVLTRGLDADAIAERILSHAPDGVGHIVEVAFAANADLDERLLGLGGSIATYATDDPHPRLPFWPLVFKNVRIDFLGSDDFPREAKLSAAQDLNATLAAGWAGFAIERRFPLEDIAEAHRWIEERRGTGRVVLDLGTA